MNLGFSTIFPRGATLKGKPTGFVAKIKRGDKIHSIREDKTNRWKAGNKIHCCTGMRTKKYKLFQLGECKSAQRIIILHTKKVQYMHFGGGILRKRKLKTYKYHPPVIIIGSKKLSEMEIEQLAKNDGFKNSAQFFEWFNTDFTGKIIHFTDFKY